MLIGPVPATFVPRYARYLNGQTTIPLFDELTSTTRQTTNRKLSWHIKGPEPDCNVITQDIVWTKKGTGNVGDPDYNTYARGGTIATRNAHEASWETPTRPEVINSNTTWGTNEQLATTLHWLGISTYKYFKNRFWSFWTNK